MNRLAPTWDAHSYSHASSSIRIKGIYFHGVNADDLPVVIPRYTVEGIQCEFHVVVQVSSEGACVVGGFLNGE